MTETTYERKSVLILHYRPDQGGRWEAGERVTWAEYVRMAETQRNEGGTWKAVFAD